MIWGFLYSDYSFESYSEAEELFELLLNAPEPLRPVQYGQAEPVRNHLLPEDLSEPVRLLVGDSSGGSVYLETAGFDGTYVISWLDDGPATWKLFLDEAFFAERERTESFVELVEHLTANYGIIYGSVGPRQDWKEEHWIASDNNGGSQRKIGLNLDNCLPVITWLAVFDEQLLNVLDSAEATKRVPIERRIRTEDGLLLVLRPSPFDRPQPERLRHSRQVMDALGGDYFFDIGTPGRICSGIPGITDSGSDDTHPWLPDPEQDARFAAFRDQEVTYDGGQEVESLSSLAEMLVVYLHTDVPEVQEYDPTTIHALDDYLRRVPQRETYSYVHLFQQFGPALGAFIGESLVRLHGGEWEERRPLPHSVVVVDGQRIDVFGIAYNIIFHDMSLVDQLERVLDSNRGN